MQGKTVTLLPMIRITKTCFVILLCIVAIGSLGCSKGSDSQTNDLPNADQYFTWNLNGSKGALLSPSDSLAAAHFAPHTEMAGESTSKQEGVTIVFGSDGTTGTFTAVYADFTIGNKHYWAPNTLQVKVTRYGNVGDYLVGSYSGSLPDSTSKLLPISGNFRIKRR